MALTSLLVCADAQAVPILSSILSDLGIQTEACGDPQQALARLKTQAFDALLVDCENEPDALDLIVAARKLTSNQSTLVIALVDGSNGLREVFAKGANFILYKPISFERANNSLRAARGLMRRERRVNQRVALYAEASIAYPGVENSLASLLDLSEEGIAIQAEKPLPSKCKVYFQFCLPGRVAPVRLSGEVIWQDSTGRAGIRFAQVPQTSRRLLGEWLRVNQSGAKESQPPVSEPAGLGLLSVSSSDRRGRPRRACRLSADVHRRGSAVPQLCTLSDISTGGCYVETSAPFPAGTAVDIIVRTSRTKVRIQGKVQAMHRGYGMGVAFNLQTAEEREEVQRLIAHQVPDPMSETYK